MRNDLPVNFETFYFFNLLEKIKDSGKRVYDDSQLNYLEQFLNYLFESESASSSIEKLVQFKSTSDLSIFFSDLLDHISRMKSESALQKVDTYVRDFLEMFKVLTKDDEWVTYIEKVTATGELESIKELSFMEYCNFVIDSKIQALILEQPSEQRNLFEEVLQSLKKTPTLIENLQKKVQNEKVTEFVTLNHTLFNGKKLVKNYNDYIQNFDSTVEKWSVLFKEIVDENNVEIKEILQPQTLKETKLEFEGAEETFEEVKPQEPEHTATDINDFVTHIEEIPQKPEVKKFAEEEKNRRQLLQDYIIGEISSYKEELISLLQKLSEEKDIQSENKLLENLKFFKDLGQIHSYTGVELAGQDLLKLFESVFKSDKSITRQMITNVEGIFQILPDYVSSSASAESSKHISDIKKELLNFGSIIGEEEQITIQNESTLKETYYEILDRKIKIIRHKLDENISEWTEKEVSELGSTLNNIFFWSNILKLNNVVNGIDLLKQLLLTSVRKSLSLENKNSIKQFVDFMGEEYSNDDDNLWISATDKLQNISFSFASVPIDKAIVAFQEVTGRHFKLLLNQIDQPQISSSALFSEVLPQFFKQLNLNVLLLQDEDLKESTQKMLSDIENYLPYSSEIEPNEKEYLKPYIEEILEQFDGSMSGSLNFEALSAYFGELQDRVSQPPQEVTTQDEVEEKVDTIADSEIQAVFEDEALKYVSRIQNAISKLENENDEDSLDEMGVVLHTLKGSSQMIGRTDISQLAAKFEELTDLVEDDKITKGDETYKVMKEMAESIEIAIKDPGYYSNEMMERFQSYIDTVESATDKPTETSEHISKDTEFLAEDQLVEEDKSTDVIELTEQDPELLEMFNQEVSNNINVVDQHLDNMEKFAYDKSLMQEVDRSVHEICTAAKMLGLTEIGDLSEKLEKVVDSIYQQKITNIKDIIPLLRRAILVIRELTLNRKIEQDFYEEVDEALELVLEDGSAPPAPEKQIEKPQIEERVPEGLTPQVWEAFFQEAAELCDDINYLILELEKNSENEELKHHLMRSIHTLKGSAAMVHADRIETLAHLSEEVLERYSKQNLPLTTEIFDLLLQVTDETNFILTSLKTFQQEDTQKFEEINKKLNQYIQQQEKEVIETVIQPVERIITPEKKEEEKKPKETVSAEQTYIRLNISQMNHLLNLAAELVISHTQFKNQLDELKNITPALDTELKLFEETKEHLDSIHKLEQKIQETLTSIHDVQPGIKESVKNQLVNIEKIFNKFQAFQTEIDHFSHAIKDNSETYDENIQKLNKLSNELLDEIIQARLVPIQLLFKRFQRPIRDMSHQFDKKVNLVIKGEHTELDRSLVEELYNPLIHIIRNAIDHGIETADERKKTEKNPEGTLEINAFRDRNQVTIEIKDDGKGIDLEKVKKVGLEKGLISLSDVENVSEQDVLDLLFYPGFSTMTEATLVSGRGVGLDAVKSEIEKIKGDIRVYSERGKGTNFAIRVPISLSVIQSMLVEVIEHTYSIPLSQVEETLNIDLKDFIKKNGEYALQYKGKEIPLVILGHLLGLQEKESEELPMQGKNPVIIAFDRGYHVALLVNKIVRREEILIKSLGPTLKRLKYFTGGSIMADGRVVLVLDIPQIIQDKFKTKMDTVKIEPPVPPTTKRDTKRISTKKKKETQKIIVDRKPSILVVDDSLSVRKYLNGLLSDKGFSIKTAKNGLEGLNLLKDRKFDLIITDLEMPQVSGYELIETVRLDEKHNETPIIVLTGRASEDFRNLTTNLGANAYIIKPFKDQELFDEIDKHIHYDKN